jgi:carbamoyltransferase
MTVVVGFNWPVEHDHAVGVIVDGELVFVSEEERWTRHKHSPGEPPVNTLRQALLYLKRKYGIKPKDIDAYAVNFDPKLFPMDIKRSFVVSTFEDFIKAFKDVTGEGIILNTSFNLAGEPLVETPQDAIKSYALGGLKAIYLQEWLIQK